MRPYTNQSPVDDLWTWYHRAKETQPAPPWLVQRANDHHLAAQAAREPLSIESGYAEAQARSAQEEIAGGMVSHAERCDSNARLAPRLADLGYGDDAERISSCRTSGRLMQRESDAQFIPLPDHKCRRPRVCPHCARDESARLRRRYAKRLRALARRAQLYFVTVSPSQVPADRLEHAWRELFTIFDLLRRNKAGDNISAALTTVEDTVPAPGLHHPHLHAIVAANGYVSWKAWRKELNRLLRERYAPVIAGDVYYRRATGGFVRVESVDQRPDAVREEYLRGKRRIVCDHDRDVVLLSDGTSLSVSALLNAIDTGEFEHAYRLIRPLTGARLRIVDIRHAAGNDRARDTVVLEDGTGARKARRVGALRDEFSRGALKAEPVPMSFQIDFRPITGDAFQIEKSLRELLKYLVKPTDLHNLRDSDLCTILDAGGRRFRRTRAYGLLHGKDKDEAEKTNAEVLRPVGLFRYDRARRDVELSVAGETLWASQVAAQAQARREAERSGLKDLIPPDRSAEINKALISARKPEIPGRGPLLRPSPP